MSIKGRSITWLDAAIDRGDAAGAIAAASEMKSETTLSLDYALAVLVLMAEGDPDHFDRAARRWVQRWLEERADPRAPAERQRWADLLDGLPGLEAVTTLSTICARLSLERAGAALEHLYPHVR